jgi:CheY-like chemotaxis protein
MKTLASMIGQQIETTSQAFRFAGAIFGIYCTMPSREEVIEKANNLISHVSDSEAFIVPITLSIGLFSTTELPISIRDDLDQMRNITIQTARYRLKLAQKRGGGILVTDSGDSTQTNTLFTILLIDHPGLGRNLIKRSLEKERFRVIVVDDGLQGRRSIEEEIPDLIISELMVPKVNAITLRKQLLAKPATRKIPFLLMSSTKNEATVGRALDVFISHFFWRPVMMVELLGVVKLIANRLQIQGG